MYYVLPKVYSGQLISHVLKCPQNYVFASFPCAVGRQRKASVTETVLIEACHLPAQLKL